MKVLLNLIFQSNDAFGGMMSCFLLIYIFSPIAQIYSDNILRLFANIYTQLYKKPYLWRLSYAEYVSFPRKYN